MLTIERIFLSPGHNFFGHHGRPAGTNGIVEVEDIACVAGRGLRGDRFFDYKPDYKGQVTLFSAEVFETLCATFSLPEASPAALRRNLLVRGGDLNGLIGKSFELQGVRLEGVEECRPCHWMDQALAPGAEAWLRGRGGLRCRILTDGRLRRENRWSALTPTRFDHCSPQLVGGGANNVLGTTRSTPDYSGYVLAGGASRRMGSDKAALLIHGEPFWQRQVRVLREAGAKLVTVVCAPHQATLCPGVPQIHDAVANIGPLAGLHAAIEDGVPLIGYTYWTAFDNFEWVFGYAVRFGLVAVDRATQQRLPKPSATFLGDIARRNALPDGITTHPQPGTSKELAMDHRYTPPAAEPGVVFTNVRVFDGSGSAPFAAELRVDGRRITAIGQSVSHDNARVIDGRGGVLMPGLTEAHAHLTWPTSVEKFVPGMSLPPEELTLTAARNARILLDHGFTSAYSAGALGKRIEPALKDMIDSGGMPGPRLIASSVEREPPMEGSLLDPGKVDEHGAGPANVAAFVKGCKDIGAKAVKFLISGESALKPGASLELLYTEEELMAAGAAAREHDLWLTGHAHAADAVKLGLKAGFRVLYHCTYADEEALDMLEAAKDEVFVAPSIGIIQATLDATPPPHFDMTHMKQDAALVLETQKKLVPELRRRGVRLLPGGDYGFPFNPNGRNARDLELWVQHFGYTPAEALHAATALGGQIMGMGDELGQLKEGFLADLLLVDGDPTENVAILQNKHHLKAIMKDGRFHKSPA